MKPINKKIDSYIFDDLNRTRMNRGRLNYRPLWDGMWRITEKIYDKLPFYQLLCWRNITE